MHGVDTADQYLAYYPFNRKTVKWPNKVFFCLLQCCLFNSYVTFSKDNPNSRIPFVDFMSDITENLIHTHQIVYHHHHQYLTSRKAQVEHLHLLHQNVPQKMTPPGRLDGKLKNHNLVHIPPTKNDKTPTRKCRVCAKKYQERNYISLCPVWCSSASRRLLHTISYAETLLKVCSKFQVFISYSFRVIIFLLKSWKTELWTL